MSGAALSMGAGDWLALFVHFLLLSPLAVGGAMAAAPEVHRHVVDARHWLTDGQFTGAIALAQAAPGPNLLFIALLGWQVGLNAAGGAQAGVRAWALAALGMLLAMLGFLLPSGLMALWASRWAHRHRHTRAVRAFKAGMAPLVVALTLSTGWLLVAGLAASARHLPRCPLLALAAASAAFALATRVHLLWLVGAGALLGMLGWV